MWLIIMKIKMKIENRSHRNDMNRPRSKHWNKYDKYKKCLTIMMLVCIKQNLSNIWSSIHEKVKQYQGYAEKSVAYKKPCILKTFLNNKMYFVFHNYYTMINLKEKRLLWRIARSI